ncbi:MAG: hypothetical protein DDT42_01776 [candidate division WS2 bacterium]|uniref:Ternary complex associated domain-containing protein n=1 Tax=Psychracetigena formicireducens TaxID=2986056 RepID=A0A9E2BMW4_PSYF1|nr:hypothetical protein [Candidatus Psychracetigena formicireducens]
MNAIREELRKLSIDWTKLGIYITELCRTLPNPLHKDHINFPSYNAIVPFGIIHGDLKAQNILLIDRSIIIESYPDIEVIGPENSRRPRDVCLIDYANIKQANLFSDLADLETSIKFQLLGMETIKWEELINLEEHILNTLAPQATTKGVRPIQLPRELQIALSSIVAIRETAKKICEKDQRIEPLSFFVHLYVHTLKNIIHKDKTPAQKLYAYISAALILEKQLAKRRINGPDSY